MVIHSWKILNDTRNIIQMMNYSIINKCYWILNLGVCIFLVHKDSKTMNILSIYTHSMWIYTFVYMYVWLCICIYILIFKHKILMSDYKIYVVLKCSSDIMWWYILCVLNVLENSVSYRIFHSNILEIHISDFQGQIKSQISWPICLIVDCFNNHLLAIC